MDMANFGGLPEEYLNEQDAGIVVIPVPYDGTSTWIKGADRGPGAILDASANMELYDIETGTEVYRKGIFTCAPVTDNESPESMVRAVAGRVARYLEAGKFPVVIGGEHSVSIGSIQAFASHYSSLSVLQLDAHSDLRNEYEGSENNHACVMARAMEVASVVQVGIRATDSGELSSMDTGRVFFAHQIQGDDSWMDRVVNLLSDDVYITIDLDVFDPAIMPSTGTPEPGGMDWYQVMRLLEKVISARNLVGFDVVELCPSEANRAPDFLAAKLIYRILSMQYAKK
jgi:agmatinase